MPQRQKHWEAPLFLFAKENLRRETKLQGRKDHNEDCWCAESLQLCPISLLLVVRRMQPLLKRALKVSGLILLVPPN